ncbi:BON domain-containing protein [soil metagenome]
MPIATDTFTEHELRAAIMEELEWAPQIDAAHIGVSVDEGVITLSGEVRTYAEKLAADKAALRVHGVTALANEITVELADTPRTDADVASAARSTLGWISMIPADSITVEVSDHVVTLSGSVDWEYERQSAARAVGHLTGVAGVVNRVELNGRSHSPATEESIKRSLDRQFSVGGNKIVATVEDTQVVLRGIVDSWDEKRQAARTAWSSPHVTDVENLVKIRR